MYLFIYLFHFQLFSAPFALMLNIIIDTFPFLDQLSRGRLQEHLQASAASCSQVKLLNDAILVSVYCPFICIILSD